MNTGTRRRISVTKDTVLCAVGIGGIIWQQVTGDVNFALLGVFTAMAGVPGLTNIISMVRGPGTASSSQPSVSPESHSDFGNSRSGGER